MRRARRARAATPGAGRARALVAWLVAWLVVLGASAAAGAPNPATNIRLGALPPACATAASGSVCETASLRALDAARAKLGLGRYLVPADFLRLTAVRQWLILANLDRIAYSLAPIAGLSPTLNTVARQGATARRDPNPVPLLKSLRGQSELGFASNWAGGQANALLAYYGWMYDDGYPGNNLDCRSPSAPGCWGHRQDILAFPRAAALSMGAAVLRSAASYALTLVDTSAPVWAYGYTWAAAMADGAGSARPRR